MKIGVLVGKTDKGYEVVAGPSEEINQLKDIMDKILVAGGKVAAGKSNKQYSKLWLGDVSHRPVKARSCRG